MPTNVRTDNKDLVTQFAKGFVFQPADPVFLKPKGDPGVAPHYNISSTIKNPAGTVFDKHTKVATRDSYLGAGKHLPIVIVGRNTAQVNGDNGFTSWMKNVFIEKRNAVMHGVKTSVNALWSMLPPAIKTALANGTQIAQGMTLDDFGDAAKEDAAAMMGAMMSTDTLMALAQTAALMGVSAIPVVGQIAGGAAAVQRISAAIDSVQGASAELKAMMDRWSQPMSPQQMAAERKKLASFLIRVGISAILAALGKAAGKLSAGSKGKENSSMPIVVGQRPLLVETCRLCSIGDPVIIASGEKTVSSEDFVLPGRIPIEWTRKYRSGDTRRGWFGQGWSTPLAVTLALTADASTYHDESGRAVPLPCVAPGSEQFDPYSRITVRRPTQDDWELRFKGGQTLHFRRAREDMFALPLAAISDTNGNRISLDYPAPPQDPFDPWRPTSITDAAGRTLRLAWDARGLLTGVVLEAGGGIAPILLAQYAYSADGDLAAHSDGAGTGFQYEWTNHVLVAYVLPDGARYCAEYDEYSPAGRVVHSYAAVDGRGLRLDYHERARATRVTDALGRTTVYEYDERKDIIAVTGPDGMRVDTSNDANGNARIKQDPLGRSTQFRFDERGNLTELVDAAGARIVMGYNAQDLKTAITDALGHLWQREYDERGNLTVAIDPLGNVTRYDYDGAGQVSTITDARGGIRRLEWDACGNLLAMSDCSGQVTRFAYDAMGRPLSRTDAAGQSMRYRWNAAGHIEQIEEPGGGVHHYQWSASGRLLEYKDQLGNVTRYRYNGHGEPVERRDANGHAMLYAYDSVGRLTGLTNENGETTRFFYDLADQLSDEIGIDGRHQRYCYNGAGELTHMIESGGSDIGPGKVTRFERDAMGRLVRKHTVGDAASEAAFAYDALGRMTAADNASARIAFAYDPVGHLLGEIQTLGGGKARALAHAYDVMGNRTQTRLPDGRMLNWLFYGSGHLHQINIEQSGQHHVIADIERDAIHREVSRTQGALQTQYDYDPMGRLVRHRTSRAGARLHGAGEGKGAVVVERSYRYDLAGNLTRKLDSLRGEQVNRYDALGRISSSNGRDSEQFAFDPAGNLLPSSSGQSLGMVVGNRLRVHQDLRYTYDVHGNILTRKKGAHEHADFAWNADHQLQQATVTRHGVTQTTSYEYDALGRRTCKSDLFGRTEYLWDGNLMIEMRRGHDSALFVFEPDSFIPLATIQKDRTYWYQCDQNGVPQELTGADGELAWMADYKVWGEARFLKTGTDSVSHEAPASFVPAPGLQQPFRFQGQQFDDETGLHYNRFRYYDPGIGRFVSQDPVGFIGGDHFYLYANNPSGWDDPLGLAGARGKYYPSRVRKSTREELEKKATGPDNTMRCAKCDCVITSENASVQHEPSVVELFNTDGHNTNQEARTQSYNDHATSLNCLACQKAEGGSMSHKMNYRTDTGPSFEPKPKRKKKDGC